jgi:hypothetical protein
MPRKRRTDDQLAPSRHPAAVSQYERERYRNDPEYRLRRINHTRAMRGRPLVASLDEVNLRGV